MKEITYTCKFCKQQRTFEVEWTEACDQFNLAKWIPILACNRCAEHERKRRDLQSSIVRLTFQIIADRKALKGQAALKAEDGAREAIGTLLARFATCVCDHLFIQTQFDRDFTDQIMEKPEVAHKLLGFYRQSIIKIARDAHSVKS